MRGRSRDDRGPRRRIRRRSSSASSSGSSSRDADADGRPSVGDGEALSFEHLEAIRGVALLTRNEYPLPHLTRDKLFKPDDAYAECGCPFPSPDDDEADKGRCEDVSCLNFATYIECSASRCDAGKYCHNQRLQHPERFPELEAFKTLHKGFGVRARTEIAQNTVIGEYVGEVIDEKELQRRLKNVPRHELNFYYLALEPGVYIDARNKGSFTRFMNHSCEPNCKTEKWTVKGETRIAVVAQRAIQEREELTFDYQWKSLGSMQIKCYCGSANCKGVIGSEVDASKTVVDNGPRGFYRDPTKDETRDALVGRHLRLFSPTDTSVYTIATVRGFNAENGLYELEYGDSVGTPQDTSFDSPLSAVEELRSQPFVKLDEHSWQIFVELTGLSEDQIEEAVFAIPKRRHSEPAVIESDSPRKSDHAVGGMSPSPSSGTPSSTPGPGPAIISQDTTPSQEERRDQHGELLDGDGDIVTTKLLIKGLPPKCDEALLRRLFLAPRNSRSSSLLEKLQASMVSQRPSSAIVVKLDFFFFDDTSGWALVEFSDSSYPKYFRRNLNSRALSGQALRVFLAGRREVDNFERAKRNNAIHREEKRAAEARNGATAIATTPTMQTPKAAMKYPYGRTLDWLVSIESVEDSPSRRKGTSATLEEKLRSQYVQMILAVATNLHLDREDSASAILALHRYFTFCPMQNVEFMAAGMLHIYLKAHGRKFAWPDFVSEVYAAKYHPVPSGGKSSTVKLKPESDVFKRCERQILETENDLLEGLLFDISSENPYALMDLLTSANKFRKKGATAPDSGNLQQVPPDVQKEAKRLLGYSLRLSVWAHTPVECVVLSVLYVGAAVTGALVYSGTNEPFVTCLTPPFLPWLDPVENEKDALALLDCSLCIVDSFKDRWLRLDTNAKAQRLATDSADPNYFDTEQFAVQRHKPIEITQRITMLLKAWIEVKGSPGARSEDDMASHLALLTLDDLKRRRRTGSFNISDGDNEQRPTKASDVLRLEPAPKGGVAQIRKPQRLHVCHIENAQQVRKHTFLGKISAVEGIDVAEKPVFLLPWPYREHEPVFSEQTGLSRACARELSTSLIMSSRAPKLFLGLTGIVFPDETNPNEDFNMDLDTSETKRPSQLQKTGHYCAYEMPLHMYTGVLDAKVDVPMQLRKKVIYDMLNAMALCHEWGYVHRYIAPCNLFVFRDSVRLGGYHAIRKLNAKTNKSDSRRYEMSDSERKEHCHGSWLQVTPPEVLLGDRVFSTRGDVWSAGCVALMLLFDRIPFLQGPDLKAQVNLIFRICGTPSIEWPDGMKLPQYAPLKPKHDYKMRLRKTLLEHRQDKRLDVPTEAIDVLEAMLQLDPSKRSNARKLLEMEYFADFRRQEPQPPIDFSSLPPTFDALRRKLEHQLMKASSSASKRRRMASDYDRPDSASSADSNKSRRHSSSSSRRTSSAHSDENGETKRGSDDDDDIVVPLPDHFRDTVMADATASVANGEHEPTSKKRAKLGWGMGLNS